MNQSEAQTYTKVIRQYSRELPEETLLFLRGIEADYRKVKNAAYQRYSGIKHLNRLKPAYDILTEMRHCGLREQLNLPAVYYELAVAEAVTDIRIMWETVRNRIRERIRENESLSGDDRKYLRTVLKIDSTYAAILNRQQYELPRNMQTTVDAQEGQAWDAREGQAREAQAPAIDFNRLNNLLRRLTRRYLTMPEAGGQGSFRVSPNGYKYKDGGIYLVSRTLRQRVFVPLKDQQTTERQIRIRVRERDVVISIPVEAKIRRHGEYGNTRYAYIGYTDMLTLSNGAVYGRDLNTMVSPETERLNRKNRNRGSIRRVYAEALKKGDASKAKDIEANNFGTKKYDARKERERERTQNYINAEIGRMLRTEKPARIVITRPVLKNRSRQYNRVMNRSFARSFSGYIRKTLRQKCEANGIVLTEISAKGTGSICSSCGAAGERTKEGFRCAQCGLETSVALNSARNIERIAASGSEGA